MLDNNRIYHLLSEENNYPEKSIDQKITLQEFQHMSPTNKRVTITKLIRDCHLWNEFWNNKINNN